MAPTDVSEIPVPLSHSPMWNHGLLFFCVIWFRHGIRSKPSHWGSYDVLVSWYCMCWTMCAWKININLCADFVPTQTLWVYVSLCSGLLCFSVSGSDPAPAPLSLCVFVCADLFQQCSFGQALGASSLSAPVWTQKPLTTFDSVNILAPFNMQPEVLCKDEEWGGWWEGREEEGLGMRGWRSVVSKFSWNLTLMVLSSKVTINWFLLIIFLILSVYLNCNFNISIVWSINCIPFIHSLYSITLVDVYITVHVTICKFCFQISRSEAAVSPFHVFFVVFVMNSSGGTLRPVDCTSASLARITELPSTSRCSRASCYLLMPDGSSFNLQCLINEFWWNGISLILGRFSEEAVSRMVSMTRCLHQYEGQRRECKDVLEKMISLFIFLVPMSYLFTQLV